MVKFNARRQDHEATDEQLLANGMSPRTLELSMRYFLRPGAVDLDMAYCNAVYDAKCEVALAALFINNPQAKHVWFPAHDHPFIGKVRHG